MAQRTRRGLLLKVGVGLGGAMGLGLLVSYFTGHLGFAIGEVRAQVFPRDTALLEYVPDEARAVLIVDPHRLDLMALGGPRTQAAQQLSRAREDVKKLTGIDLFFDVDKLALSTSGVVARGRFDRAKISAKLQEARYKVAEYKGHPYLIRAEQDALCVLDDVFIYGDLASITQSIDARETKRSFASNEAALSRLEGVGWAHAVIGTVQFAEAEPSIRQALVGASGPRAYTVAVTTKAGATFDVRVETLSQSAATETAKLLDEQRRKPLYAAALGLVNEKLGAQLNAAAQSAEIAALPNSDDVQIKVHLTPENIEGLSTALSELMSAGNANEVKLLRNLLPF